MPSIRRVARNAATLHKVSATNWHPGHMFAGMQAMIGKLNTVDCVIEVHDARIPFIGRNQTFKHHLGLIKPHILVLNKVDLADLSRWDSIQRRLQEQGDENIVLTNLTGDEFSYNQRGYDTLLKKAITLISKSDRHNRELLAGYNIMIVGIPNVGKSTLINRLRQHHLGFGGKASRTGSQAGVTRHVEERVKICGRPLIYTLDTPGVLRPSETRNHKKAMDLALCSAINDKVLKPMDLASHLLDYLNKTENDMYLEPMGLKDPAKDVFDLCKKSLEASVSLKQGNGPPMSYDAVCWRLVRLFRSGRLGKVIFL